MKKSRVIVPPGKTGKPGYRAKESRQQLNKNRRAVSEMLEARKYLNIVHDRGQRGLDLNRVYRGLRKPDLFLMAYMNLYANEGAMTPGTDLNDSIDGMSVKRIKRVIKQLEQGTFKWRPTKRTYIPKSDGKLRPLGLPNWTDKLVQEAIRLILNAYYEPRFSDLSHGFRSSRGCHTALAEILGKWKGTKWFIEGDIRGCFDEIGHSILLDIIARNIKDTRFLKLLRKMLEAGYLEDWRYFSTYSGVPQGGVISPLLSNVYLNEVDMFVENELIPRWTKGKTRRENPEYRRLRSQIEAAEKANDYESAKELRKIKSGTSWGVPNDPGYRRLRYVRYADDFLLGFVGTRAEAEEIKQELGDFLRDKLNLEMSETKTLITHATTGKARFLGYDVRIIKADSRKCKGRRSVNYQPVLEVPDEVIREWMRKYQKNGKSHHRAFLTNNSDYDIVMTYNQEFQGVVNYYLMAHNVSKWYKVKYAAMQSLVKTLAAKHKRKVTWVYKRYAHKSKEGRRAISARIDRKDKKPLIATFGAKPICYNREAAIKDKPARLFNQYTELAKRMQAERCELCGEETTEAEVHHIKKMKDLRKRYQGRKDPPGWVKRMMALRRKTLVVCKKCHLEIHAGTYDGKKVN